MIDDEDLFGSVVLLCTVVFFGLSLIRTRVLLSTRVLVLGYTCTMVLEYTYVYTVLVAILSTRVHVRVPV